LSRPKKARQAATLPGVKCSEGFAQTSVIV